MLIIWRSIVLSRTSRRPASWRRAVRWRWSLGNAAHRWSSGRSIPYVPARRAVAEVYRALVGDSGKSSCAVAAGEATQTKPRGTHMPACEPESRRARAIEAARDAVTDVQRQRGGAKRRGATMASIRLEASDQLLGALIAFGDSTAARRRRNERALARSCWARLQPTLLAFAQCHRRPTAPPTNRQIEQSIAAIAAERRVAARARRRARDRRADRRAAAHRLYAGGSRELPAGRRARRNSA